MSGQSPTGGRETFLEVRMQITDTDATKSLSSYGASDGQVVSGYGGHWVYLICEKLLAGGDGDLKL